MKHHFPALHMHHTQHAHHGLGAEHWVTDHARLVAFVLACLIGSIVVTAMAAIKLYITTGVWPLPG